MDIKILMKDGTAKAYRDIAKIFNQSTRLKSDTLCLKTFNDDENKPSICIKFSEIVCFKIEQPIQGGNIKLWYK